MQASEQASKQMKLKLICFTSSNEICNDVHNLFKACYCAFKITDSHDRFVSLYFTFTNKVFIYCI